MRGHITDDYGHKEECDPEGKARKADILVSSPGAIRYIHRKNSYILSDALTADVPQTVWKIADCSKIITFRVMYSLQSHDGVNRLRPSNLNGTRYSPQRDEEELEEARERPNNWWNKR